MEFFRSFLGVLILLIISTGSESGPPVVKVGYNGTAVLPCSERCSGVARWTFTDKSEDILAECDQTSCRSVKEGYQMIYNQYLQGDLSLIITEADFSKRGWYTCDCDGRDQCDVLLQVEARRTSVPMKSGGSLVMELEVSDPVEVIYSSRGSADGSWVQICTVIGGSLQCESEYTNRTSLSSSAALELRDMEESDSGVYTVRTIRNTEDIHIYTVTVIGDSIQKGGRPKSDPDAPSRMRGAVLVVAGVVGILVCLGVILMLRKKKKFCLKNSLNGAGLPEKSPLSNH